MKKLFVTRNADRMGVGLGVVFAVLGWYVAAVLPHEGAEGKILISIVAINGLAGFSFSRIASYLYVLKDPNQEKTVRLLFAFYMGSWFGCIQATSMGIPNGIESFAIHGIFQTVAFGGVMYVFGGSNRKGFDPVGHAYDLGEPSELNRKFLWYPFAMVICVIILGITFQKPIPVALVWAGFLVGMPELHPRRSKGTWRRLGGLWFTLCVGAVSFSHVILD